jgi:Xaa-Pro dipeptidase
MRRREFLQATGALALARTLAPVGTAGAIAGSRAPGTAPLQEPTLGPEVFARRLERLRLEMEHQERTLVVMEPGTNFQYYTAYNPGRSERLILLMIPLTGDPVIVCPSFEVERLRRSSVVADLRGWEEQGDPWRLVRAAGDAMKPRRRRGRVAIEPSTRYGMVLRLENALGGYSLHDATDLLEPVRMIKTPEEVALIRRAIAITEASIAATFGQLAAGMTERDVARLLSREMQTRGASGGGLVQFGPSSALPHGGPGGAPLAPETVVLIDAGSSVSGYTSDITRTTWFGSTPSDEFRQVFNLVHDAQTAAMELARPLLTQCQDLDRAARARITAGGFGEFFTHRLGHGMGMDGHEQPYLVEGNERRLEPGMVFTIEPGIYQLGKFGVRIEDDCLVTEDGLEVMSVRPAKL